jgi:hypothetical protein
LIVTQPRSAQSVLATVGLFGLSMSFVTFAAQLESPVVPKSPTTVETASVSTLKSPLPDLMSDKAYAAAMANDARIVSVLLAHPTADHLATAALFARLPSKASSPGSPLELIRRATLLAPKSPELAWLELSICRRADCDATDQIEKRIQKLDPDNGLLWAADLDRSIAAASEPEVTELVNRIGASPKITFYWNPLMVMMFDALAVGDPKLGLSERGITAAGMLAGTIIPPLQPLSKACRVEQLARQGRHAACEALMSRLEQSSSTIGQMLALSIQERWWPPGSPERAVLATKRRRLDYVLSQSSRMRLFRMNHDMALRVDAARRYEREEDVDLALIKSFGLPAEPPAEWKDKFANPSTPRLPP